MIETPSVTQRIAQYLTILRRGKFFVIIPIIGALIIGSAIAFKLPPVYRSETKIFYMQAQIPEWAQLETINIYLEAAIVFVEALTFSKDSCIKIIEEQNLFPDLIGKVPTEKLIATVKENYTQRPLYTTIPSKGGRTEEIITGFEFYFDHTDPQTAFNVANILAKKFIGHYRKFREGFATKTSSFFEDERKRLKQEIANIDQKISEFKEKNVNYLPELFQLNYRMLESLENKIFEIGEELRLLNRQKGNLELNLVTINPLTSLEGLSGERIITPEEKLTALKAELDILLTTCSEKHPDVIRSRAEIEALEKLLSKKQIDKKHKNNKEKDVFQTSQYYREEFVGLYNPAYINLVTQIEHLNLEIESLKNEKKEYEKDIIEYQLRVEKAPLVEKEYKTLNRELESAQNRYNKLVNQVLTLESAAAMEKREMGAKLTIGQPPTFPLKPIKPNRPLIIASSFILGAGLGILILLGWEGLTQRVRTPQDLAKLTNIPVISEIPTIITDQKRKQKGSKKSFE